MTNSTIPQTSDMNQLTAATYATLPFSGLRGVDCAAVAAVGDDWGAAASRRAKQYTNADMTFTPNFRRNILSFQAV